MFKKIFEYAGPYKKNMYVATVVVLVSVLMGILPFVLAYQVISPLVIGDSVETEFVLLRVIGVLICLVLQAFFYGWGLSISHKAAYNTLFRLRVSLQKKFEKLPLGIVEEKGTGTIKKLFVDDVDSLELLLAHSVPEGIANLLIPLVIYVAMFCADWKLALMSLASIPISLLSMVIMYSVGMKRMGPYYQSAQKMNNTIIEYINGMEVVKVFNRESESYENFRKDVTDYRDYTLAWYKAAWPWMAIYGSLLDVYKRQALYRVSEFLGIKNKLLNIRENVRGAIRTTDKDIAKTALLGKGLREAGQTAANAFRTFADKLEVDYSQKEQKHTITKAVLAPMKAVNNVLVSMELHLDASIDKLDNLAMNVQIDKEKHKGNVKSVEQTEPERAEAERVEAEVVYSPMVAEPQEYQYNADAFENYLRDNAANDNKNKEIIMQKDKNVR